MTVFEMASQAKNHWSAYYPETYQAMVLNGDLESEATAAADLTLMEMKTLRLGGATEWEAWEAARGIFIFNDPANTYRK